MHPTRLVIKNIQTTELLYFDPAFVDQGYQFCRDRDIDCLPSLDDLTHFYRRDDQVRKFRAEKLTPERCISSNRAIFHPALLKQLQKNHILFVIDDGELSGVVHFSDYNKPIVSDFLYTYLAAYERSLRQLAIMSKFSETDMEDYFHQKLQERESSGKDGSYFQGKLHAIERQKNHRAQTPPFQRFYLDDLLGLLKHKGTISLQGNVRDLRNSVMHAHEPVNMVDVTTPDYIYDFATFETFFKRVQALFEDTRRVQNRIRFLENGDSNRG